MTEEGKIIHNKTKPLHQLLQSPNKKRCTKSASWDISWGFTDTFWFSRYNQTIVEKVSRQRSFAISNVRLQPWDIRMCTATLVAAQLHFQQALIFHNCCHSMLFDFLDCVSRITKERGVERVPVFLVLQVCRIKILAYDMKMQLPHRWNLDDNHIRPESD